MLSTAAAWCTLPGCGGGEKTNVTQCVQLKVSLSGKRKEQNEKGWENKSKCDGRFTTWAFFQEKSKGENVSGAWNDTAASEVCRELIFSPALSHSHSAYYILCQTTKAKRTCLIPARLWTAVYGCRCRKINSVWIIQMHVCQYISFSCDESTS